MTLPVPAGANLTPDTIYPYSVQAKGANGQLSPIVNSFGTTLKVSNAPTNMIGGSSNFSGVVSVPANTAVTMNALNGNGLTAGDNSNAETLTVTFQPTAGNFGTISLSNNPALPGTVTVTGGGTNGSPLVISGPKADVNTALNNFVYTPQNGFIGPATVTMTTVDTVEGVVTPDDVDTLVFSVNSGTPTPPRNLMNANPVFSNLLTAINTPIILRPLSNSHLGVEDVNGDNVNTVLTPANGTIALVTVPTGLTVNGAGTAASPLELVGPPHYISSALNGGLTFTPTANFVGNGTIQMASSAVDGSDNDSLTIQVINPSNLFNGSTTFPATAQRMAKATTTVFNGAGNKALTVLYPAASTVRVNLTLLDGAGNNAGNAANGNLTVGALAGVTVTNNGTADVQVEGLASNVNTLLTTGVTYSPQGNNVGNYRLRMNSVDINNGALTDTNDIVLLEVSEPPQNRYNNSPTSFPPIGTPVELGFNTPLTFASFFGTALSVLDGDSATVTTTLTPSNNGTLTRANLSAVPAGVTITVGATVATTANNVPVTATNAQPMVISGSPTNINLFLNNGIVFTPTTNFSGAATVTMSTTDGGGTDGPDITHINVLPPPENRRNDNATFITTAIPAAPGVAAIMNSPNEITGSPANRLLTVRNYPSAANVDVTLTVPATKGTLLLNGFPAPNGVQGGVTYTGNGTINLQMTGTQANLNTALTNLRYTPNAALVGAPETVNITMTSSGGTLGDSGDTVPFLITNPPRNIYNAQEGNPVTDDTAENASFPAPASRLTIFSDQALLLNNTATATQPAVRLDVIDDSTNVTVTLTPANTVGNTTAAIDLTAAAPGTVTNTGAGTNASPRVLSGPLADVKTAMALLRYTPQAGFTGDTSFNMVVNDGGPSPDTNTVELNVRALPQNEFNTTTTTFPGTNIPMVIGVANPIADDGTAVNTAIHEIGVRNLASYTTGQTATVRLQIPNGTLNVTLSGGVTVTAGANGSGDMTLSATHPNITNLNTVLGTLTWTPGALADGVAPTAVNLTMTHGPIPDTDTLPLLATRPPRNLYGGNAAFPGTRRIVNEGTALTFTGAGDTVSVGSQTVETVEDSANIRVTLTPSLIGGTNSGTVNIPVTAGVTISGAGTNASPRVIEGAPAAINTALAGMTFTSGAGMNGNAQIDMVTTDFGSRDLTDSILLDVRAQPSNRFRMPSVNGGNATNTFSGTGAARPVPLNGAYLLNNFDGSPDTLDRPQVQVEFYNVADTVTVDLTLTAAGNPATGNLQVTTANSTVTGNSSAALRLVGTQVQVNADLQTLRFNAPNSAGAVDMEMRSTNGTVGDNTATQDVIRLNVQNQAPVNSLSNTNSGFANIGAATTPLPLRTVSDTTTVDDLIDFGQTDPTSAAAGNFTVTANTWPTLSIADDDTSVTTRLTPPTFGNLSDRVTPGTPFAGLGLTSVSGTGTNADPFILVGSVANINTALLRLRFTPNANVANGTNGNLVIRTTDGAAQFDEDNTAILVERPTLPATFSSNPNPSGTVFRAVYQFGRDKLPQIVVNDVTISGPEIQAGAQIEIIRYNDNDPTTTADDDTDVLRTITLNNPNAGLGESVAFNNQTNRATVTVDFSAAGSPVLPIPGTLNDGTGKIGGRLVGGNVDTPSTSSVAAASHPWFIFTLPERAQFAVEDYGTSPNRGRWYLINTSSSLGAGLGRLTMIFDSNGALNIQNGLNNTGDVSTGLAKNPVNGEVYYIDQEGTSPNFTSRLIRWIPRLGIQNDRGGAGSATDPYIPRGALTVNNGLGLSYNFGDKPARLVFNSTVNGGVKTPTLYAGAAYEAVDGAGSLSGFYRIRNFESGTPAVDHIKLFLGADEFGFNTAYLNNGDLVFEPDTDNGATANNRMFLSTNARIFVSTAPVPDTGTANVDITELTLPAGVLTALRHDGTAGGVAANQLVGLSIDGEWAAGARSLLVIARYPAPHATLSRLYRLTYDSTTYAITGATLLNNGNFGTNYLAGLFNPAGPIPLVDITAAHLP